ncbi:MAG: Asp-tRNA(Asn)/Glu-tRNA(Gln) amidotransferase subunit GatA [Gammaproteobacteria bacterium]|nr:Asp-tRNA(Asn)/Glu-tRNA(Gln) amidotransferase subunit GatA [Gammaproteobacteria bacterium]
MKPYAGLRELTQGLRSKAFSTVELTQFYLDRIHRLNERLNCFITVDDEAALERAKLADQRLSQTDVPRLCGIPIAHKDLFCTKGLRTTCASRTLASFVAPYDATVVRQTSAAGANMLGKTNMDEFAMGSSNETSYFGPVSNPWDATRSPGGSSGGSAAAVAAGLVPFATGTDTGGSIRQPAGLCGVTGLKPTYGRVSRFGMIAFASSLDQGGPVAHSVEDAYELLRAMEGYDPADSTSANVEPTALPATHENLVIGYPEALFDGLDAEFSSAIDAARGRFEALGHSIKTIELPHVDAAIAAYYVLSGAEASTNLARYDGVRYGHRSGDQNDLADMYRSSRSEGFGLEVKRRILTGTYSLSVGYFDAYYLKAQKVRRLVRDGFLAAFADVDLILAPVAPTPAFELGSLKADPVQMYRQDIYTIPVSLAGLPGLSMPCGFVDGLPIGMQLIGKHFEEGKVLAAGMAYQQETNWHEQHPALGDESVA